MAAFGVCAAAQTTTIAQTIVGPDNSAGNGTAVIHASLACTGSGNYLSQRNLTVKFLAGNFSVALIPLDNCTPGQSNYAVDWSVCTPIPNATKQNPCPTGADTRRWSENWLVPTSNTTLTVDQVVVVSNPIGDVVQIGYLAKGLGAGRYCVVIADDHSISLQPCGTGATTGLTWQQEPGTWATTTGTWAAQ
jgi:hypothetical protein